MLLIGATHIDSVLLPSQTSGPHVQTMNINSSNDTRPDLLPIPPYEQLSSLAALPCPSSLSHYDYNTPPRQDLVDKPYDRVDMPFNDEDSFLQNRQNRSDVQHQYRSSLSDRQNQSLISGLHASRALTQPFDHRDMSGLSASSNGILAAGQSHESCQRLDVQSNYSHDQVKVLMFDVAKQAQNFRAEIKSLQSVNIVLERSCGDLHRKQLDMLQQIQRYKHTIVQKDRQLEAMHERGWSIERRYKQVSEDHVRLIATLRKQKGTGNPSAIARSIRWNHASNPIAAASQGGQYSAKASPLYCANVVQPFISRHGSEQTFSGDQEPVQLVSTPCSSAVTVTDASSWSQNQQGYAAANHNTADPLQLVTIPASSEIDIAKASSPALSQPGSINANHHGTIFRRSQFATGVRSSPPLGVTIGSMAIDGQNNKHATGQELKERLTIDLTEDAQPRSCLASHDQLSHKPRQRSLSWLQGENPKETWTKTYQRTGLPDPRQLSQGNTEECIALAESPAAGRVAPLPEAVTARKTKEKTPKKTKVVLNAEAKKERAKRYRKTAAEKKRTDKELAQQSLQRENMSNDPLRAQKRDQRAAKREQRQREARQASGELGLKEPQMTLDGRLYQENIGVLQDVNQGSIERAATYDHNSLFGDDEDGSLEMKESKASSGFVSAMHEEDTAVEVDRHTAYVAELEAVLAADADARMNTGIEQNAALGEDDGYCYFSSNGEESEE